MDIYKLPKFFSLLIIGIFAVACTVPTAVSPPTGSSASPTSTAASTPSPAIQLEPCRLGSTPASCGTLKVYENRIARSGRMIELRVAVIKAQSEEPAPDPIFYVAGGPGDAATEDGARQQFPFSLSYNHDLVFVDQRGTGGSNRVLIPTDSPDPTGLAPEEADARVKAWVDKFLSEIEMDPRYYTTSMAMDDLDDARRALGYEQINLFGYSYGATAAQYYLRQHEEQVRTVTLGGGSLLDTPVFELWAKNGQRALNLIFDQCEADSACHSAFPDVREEFKALLERLAVQPVTVADSDRQPEPITYTPDYLAPVIRYMIKDGTNIPVLPLLIHRAYQENDWEGFTQFILNHGNYEWWDDQVMEHVIRCGEKWAAFDPDEVARLSDDSFLKGFDVSLAQNQAFSCHYTPRGVTPEGLDAQPGSQVPVLIINGELDPIDPPENMAGAETLWPNSTALVLPYQSHNLSDREAIMCLWSIEDAFIQTGSAAGLNSGCLKDIQPTRFVTPR